MPEGVGAEAVGMGRRLRGERLFEVARFCFVGGMCFLIDYGLLFVCTEYGGIPYLWSSGISFSVSVLVNYWLCLAYVFRGAGQQSRRQRVLFLGAGDQPGRDVGARRWAGRVLHGGKAVRDGGRDVLELCDEAQGNPRVAAQDLLPLRLVPQGRCWRPEVPGC